jgi:hypothetical protein
MSVRREKEEGMVFPVIRYPTPLDAQDKCIAQIGMMIFLNLRMSRILALKQPRPS